MSRLSARERLRGAVLCKREQEGREACERERGRCWGQCCARETRGEEGLCVRCVRERHARDFRKTVYKIFGCKPFSIFLH